MAKPIGNQPFSEHSYNSFHIDKDGKPFFYEDFVAGAAKAAQELIARDWVWADNFQNMRLTPEAREIAKTLTKPEWKPTNGIITLKKEDIEVLNELEYGSREGRWCTPQDCGGTNGSHHSNVLTKLTRLGYAECRKGLKIVCGSEIDPEPSLKKRVKGSRSFRITPMGKEYWKDEYGSTQE